MSRMNAQDTQNRIEEIMVELSAGELTIPEIAKEFGVTNSYIYAINEGKHGRIRGYNYPVRRTDPYPKEKYTDMEVWFEDCYEVKL
jgi:hypothetical protein